MSEPKRISPMLDNFIMGGPISDHHGIQCCPAMENGTDDRYIVKVISVPSNPSQIDALLLTGAYSDEAAVLDYFKEIADGVVDEVNILNSLAELEGFLPYNGCQIEPMESGKGFDIYLLSRYKRTLEKHFKRHSFTHLDALNLGLDLCAALSVCRRSGYLYVDLKPSNVYVTDERLYRIGDLGFIPLNSLQYAFLPEKYLSIYTPPEISDAFSALNSTMDTYAAGLILYQTYNNGTLPFNDDIKPGDKLPPPMYADYEMSEIILKACAPDSEERWQDPMQMGQAIVSYMQRNGAKDTPIVPMPDPKTVQETSAVAAQENATEIDCSNAAEVPDVIDDISETEAEDSADSADVNTQEDIDDLSFLEDDTELDSEDTDYDAITDEVSEMLNQADELATLSVPEPVVVPEHVDIPMPEPIEPEIEETESDKAVLDDSEETQEVSDDEMGDDPADKEETPPAPKEKKRTHWLRNCILILIILALLAGGYYFYKNYYLLPIESIVVEGSEDSLTVFVSTDIDESLLCVICTDTYGNQIPAPVINGKAEFDGLVPNTAYNVKIVASGFHRLAGSTATAYSTPIQSNIVQFDAVTGMTDGSVILNFTVEGPDCKEWTVLYSAEGEEERSATFSSHMVTLTDLTIDKAYTFRLVPKDALYITGQDEIVFTARKLVSAENLAIVSCMNNTLTVNWSVPEGADVAGWSVLCSNDTYNQTVVTSENTVTFQGLDHAAGYAVEIKAVGMSVSQVISIPANSVTATNFKADTSDATKLTFTWESSQAIPADGWVMRYSIAGIDGENTISCTENSAVIYPVIPNATYRVRLEDTAGNILLGSPTEITIPGPVDFSEEFDGFSVGRNELEFKMCKTPPYENWDRYDLSDEDFVTEFSSGESASFLVKINKYYSATSENVSILFVVRNQEGAPILFEMQAKPWRDMWYRNYCELDIPVLPTAAGTYTMQVYFNGGLAAEQQFTITQ